MSSTNLIGSYDFLSRNGLIFRNRIINGDMRIAQRRTQSGATASLLSNFFVSDRFTSYSFGGSATARVQRLAVTDLPGFNFAQRYTVGTAGSRHVTVQRIEGYSIADLLRQPVTISFWVRGSKNFNFGCTNYFHSSPTNSSIVKNVQVTTSWQKINFTVPSIPNTIPTNETTSIQLCFNWYPDSANLTSSELVLQNGDAQGINGTSYQFNTAGDWVECTGIQFEPGYFATEFERRPYGLELNLCQRYFDTNYPLGYEIGSAFGDFPGAVGIKDPVTNGEFLNTCPFHTTMRAKPIVSLYRPSDGIINTVEEFASGTKSVSVNTNRVTAHGFTSVAITGAAAGAKLYFYFYAADAEL